MKRLVASMAALAALAVVVPNASRAAEAPSAVYLHCGADKVGSQTAAVYGWNATKPTASVTTGAGCAQVDSDKLDGDGIRLEGTHTGLLDTMTIRMWVIDAGPVRAGAYAEWYVDTAVTIDDGLISGGAEVHVVPVASSTGASRLLAITVTGIGLTNPETDAGSHTIAIDLETASYLDGDQIAWVLDTSEVDSGVVFNPATLAPAKLDLAPAPEEE